MKQTTRSVQVILSIFLLISCVAIPDPESQLKPEAKLVAVEYSYPTPTPRPEMEIHLTSPMPATEVPDRQSTPYPEEDASTLPLRLTFPTPVAAPVSGWRPPLYPTPWAPTQFDHFYFARPIAADEINWPLADYRYGGVFLPEVVHSGIDIPAESGTPVMAVGSGRVMWSGYGLYYSVNNLDDPYGLAIAIKHDFGYQGETLYTVYGHLRQSNVTVGQSVQSGDVIGLVGQTGKVTGPHLHFEVRVGKNNFFGSRNPELWLAPPQGWGVLAARVMNRGGLLLKSHQITVHSLESRLSWKVNTYGKGPVTSDPYYQENLVLGDLPAGKYVVWIPYLGSVYDLEIEIFPGMVSYFTFRGHSGFTSQSPIPPVSAFTPPPDPVSVTP